MLQPTLCSNILLCYKHMTIPGSCPDYEPVVFKLENSVALFIE